MRVLAPSRAEAAGLRVELDAAGAAALGPIVEILDVARDGLQPGRRRAAIAVVAVFVRLVMRAVMRAAAMSTG